ncbi:MAG: PIG-L family deacetylase [Acidobacteria bacterium]|nr:PIG-L family deacetylase [Acidobacteriota bacterium]
MPFVLAAPLAAQPRLAGAPALKLALERLKVTGSVLMIAAHPDDENTELLATFALGRKLRTGYLSLTRGEGGQNLIGPEQGPLLGLIRTRELLAARPIDGAEQFFTRAIDFGYSKTAGEALRKWGREQVLGDVVWVIRNFQPDVIVARFSGTPRDGHGHHQASAILAREAFSAAAGRGRFPEQLQYVEPWQAKRLVHNLFSFTPGMQREAEQTPGRIAIETGEFDPVLGYSYAEIAAMSRSMHRSQGFGTRIPRGARTSYVVNVAGDPAAHDIFDGIDTSWNRIPGGAEIGRILAEAARTFVPEHPERIVPLLLQARGRLGSSKHIGARRRLAELEEAIALAGGLWLDADTGRRAALRGDDVGVRITAVNRSPLPWKLASIAFRDDRATMAEQRIAQSLAANVPLETTLTWKVPPDQPYSQPFWLRKPAAGDLYTVPLRMIGRPENPPVLEAVFALELGGQSLRITRPLRHRYVDAMRGELTAPFTIAPPLAVHFTEPVLMFPSTAAQPVDLRVQANLKPAADEVGMRAPAAWRVTPPAQPFHLHASGEQTVLRFRLTPPAGDAQADLRATVAGAAASDIITLDYPHIPPQVVYPDTAAKAVRAEVKLAARAVGYVMGAGDLVPQALRQIGASLELLGSADLARGDLSRFDAIVTGICAYNVRSDLRANQQRLLEYARNGGAVVVQYNGLGGPCASDPAFLENVGPYPLAIGRTRVSVEEAPIETFSHPLLRWPNAITARDFEGWVQERGLYFASRWDPRYQAPLETHDPGEPPQRGALLYARYGKGVYVFTALSFFRQLPAGVPGAYRLFANLLSAAKAAP